MRYFAKTPQATAELVYGLITALAVAVLYALALIYGHALWTELTNVFAAAPAGITYVLRDVFAVGAHTGR
jgi:hypothetical protein